MAVPTVHINRPATIAIRRVMPCPTEGVRRRPNPKEILPSSPTINSQLIDRPPPGGTR